MKSLRRSIVSKYISTLVCFPGLSLFQASLAHNWVLVVWLTSWSLVWKAKKFLDSSGKFALSTMDQKPCTNCWNWTVFWKGQGNSKKSWAYFSV
jgi:hypothetical protein